MILLPPPAEKLQNFFGVFLQFLIGVDKYQAALSCMSPTELIEKSGDIAAMQAAYDFMKTDYKFEPGDAETLLRMENPLRFVADLWTVPGDMHGLFDMSDQVGEAIEEAAKAASPQRSGQSSDQEKPSIRGQLRDAARDTGQRQPPEAKAKGGEAR